MPQEKDLRGVMFKNDNFVEGGKQPRYRGNILIAGVKYWLSCWIETSKAGDKYFSLAATRVDDVQQPAGAPPQAAEPPEPEIPDGLDIPY